MQHRNKFYFHQTIAGFRTEKLIFSNLSGTSKNFIERNPNVFASWQTDTDKLVDECCANDFRYWKVEKFVKDPKDVKKIESIIQSNWVILKDIFVHAAAKSDFPCVSSLEACLLMNNCDMLTKEFTQGIADTQFIASRVDVDKRGFKIFNQNALSCNRFEFLECIVRWAHNRFKVTGVTQTTHEAV